MLHLLLIANFFGYNDILNNDTLPIMTHISRPKALNQFEFNDKYSSFRIAIEEVVTGKASDKASACEKHVSVACQCTTQPCHVHRYMSRTWACMVRHFTHVKHTQNSAFIHTMSCIHNKRDLL